MLVNTEQIQVGLINFIEQEIARKAVGYQKFLTYFSMPIAKKKVEQYVNAFSQNEFTKDMFDESGKVDLDVVYNMAKEAVKKSGSFVAYGIVINETDIDKLYTYIRG